jgi:hypothetical protein
LGCERAHVLSAQAATPDRPVFGLRLVDHDHRYLAHALALDVDHRLAQALGDLALLLGRKTPSMTFTLMNGISHSSQFVMSRSCG